MLVEAVGVGAIGVGLVDGIFLCQCILHTTVHNTVYREPAEKHSVAVAAAALAQWCVSSPKWEKYKNCNVR